jgi:hypothetical protein
MAHVHLQVLSRSEVGNLLFLRLLWVRSPQGSSIQLASLPEVALAQDLRRRG